MKNIDIIKEMYYDPAGYGSLKTTLADAKEIDPTIKLDDVKDFVLIHMLSRRSNHIELIALLQMEINMNIR